MKTDRPEYEEELREGESQQDELFEHYSVTVDKGQAMLRIDKFLTNRMEGISRNRIQTAADAGNILVNGSAVKSSYKVKPSDRIQIVMPYPLRELEIIPENIPLDIPYEDDDLIIVNKPAGMVVHPGHGNYSGTLVNALTYHLKDLPLFQSGDMRAGLVHRIDKNTSGILVVAKNERAHARLAQQFFDHTIDRVYHALVWGNMEQEEGTVTGHIGRSLRDRLKMAVFPDGENGQACRDALQGTRTAGLCQSHRMPSRNGTARTRFASTWNTSGTRCSTTSVTAATAFSRERPSPSTGSSSKTVSGSCPATGCMPGAWDSSIRRQVSGSTSNATCRRTWPRSWSAGGTMSQDGPPETKRNRNNRPA